MFQLYILARGRKNNLQYMTKLKNIFLILSNFWKHRVFLLKNIIKLQRYVQQRRFTTD